MAPHLLALAIINACWYLWC